VYASVGDGSQMLQIEFLIASGLQFITSPVVPRVGLLRGHDEQPLNVFREYLTANNCEVVEVNLVLDEIPQDLDILILASPRIDYTPESVRKLDAWLLAAGSNTLMVFMDSGVPHQEVLERYLQEWGFGFGQATVYEPRANVGSRNFIVPVVEFHDVTEYLRLDMPMVLPAARPLEHFHVSGRMSEVLLTSTGASYAKRLDQGAITNPEQQPEDAVGPFTLAGVTQRWSMVANVTYDAKVFFFGTSGITDFISMGMFTNAQFFDGVLDVLFPEKQTISIRPKMLTAYRFAPTGGEVLMVRVILCAVIPLLILGFGLLVTMRRRNA
jgi:hypothetical protein